MPDVEPIAILVAAAAMFLIGGAYYAAFGEQLAGVSDAAASGEPPRWWPVVEVLRCLVMAAVVAGLAVEAGIDEVAGGMALGLALWVGFPLVLWVGAVVHERVPVKLAAIHGGDWLVKLLAVGALVAGLQ